MLDNNKYIIKDMLKEDYKNNEFPPNLEYIDSFLDRKT